MANEYAVNQADLVAVADAIRNKGGTSAPLAFPGGFVDAVGAIQAGSGGNTVAALWNRTIEHFEDDSIVEILQRSCFEGCTKLKSISMKNLKTINNQYFANRCTSLTELDLPNVQTFTATWGFQDCTALEVVNLPKATSIPTECFSRSTSLKLVRGPYGIISNNAFNNCSNLKTLVLTNTKVCSINNINAFVGTPFASGGTGGTVYVPAALIESYKTATNWSTLYAAGTCNFVAIEGSEYE